MSDDEDMRCQSCGHSMLSGLEWPRCPPGIRVAPSILSADFSRLGAQVDEVLDAGARVIHVDVMDGHFVPPITIGPLIASSIADHVHDAGGVVDVHLMIERPERSDRGVRQAPAPTAITIHARGRSARPPHARRDPRGGLPRRRRDQPRHPGRRRSARSPAALRPPALHDGQSGLGRAEPSSRLAGQGRAASRALGGRGRDRGRRRSRPGHGSARSPRRERSLLVAGSAVFGDADPAAAYAAIAEAAGAS